MKLFRKIKQINYAIEETNSRWDKYEADHKRFVQIAQPFLQRIRMGQRGGEVVVNSDDYDFIVYYLKAPMCLGFDLIRRG